MFRLGLRKLRRKTRQFLLRNRAGLGNGEKIVRGAIVGDRALGAEHLRAQILKPFLEENLRALRRLGLGARLPRDIDRKSTRLNSSTHALPVFRHLLEKKKQYLTHISTTP